ncbi:protein UL13 [Panine betaherpesvirus 2]|uniref:Protein UL13 n=1 Tax=Panine betaherpesvirus 2 TaxID=188763 RepID=Q8QS74_9BETA|nr:protein UL13 [Panine betaherpesvirus 2]AAM00663.1 protein UL13 [Panine betaherpesvirus 2]QXV67765.1 protein UL13 [Panine betaherpesvirus 2]
MVVVSRGLTSYYLIPLLLCKVPPLLLTWPDSAHGLDIVDEELSHDYEEISVVRFAMQQVGFQMLPAPIMGRRSEIDEDRPSSPAQADVYDVRSPRPPRPPRPRLQSPYHHQERPPLPSGIRWQHEELQFLLQYRQQELLQQREEERRQRQHQQRRRYRWRRPTFPPPDPPSYPARSSILPARFARPSLANGAEQLNARRGYGERRASPSRGMASEPASSVEEEQYRRVVGNVTRRRHHPQHRSYRRRNALVANGRDSLLLARLRINHQRQTRFTGYRCRYFGRNRGSARRRDDGTGSGAAGHGGSRPGGAGFSQLRERIVTDLQLFRLRCHGWTRQASRRIRTRWEEENTVMSDAASRLRAWFSRRTTYWQRTWVPGENPSAEAGELAVPPAADGQVKETSQQSMTVTTEGEREQKTEQRVEKAAKGGEETIEKVETDETRVAEETKVVEEVQVVEEEENVVVEETGREERDRDEDAMIIPWGEWWDEDLLSDLETTAAGTEEVAVEKEEETTKGADADTTTVTASETTDDVIQTNELPCELNNAEEISSGRAVVGTCPRREGPHRSFFRLCLGLWASSHLARRAISVS